MKSCSTIKCLCLSALFCLSAAATFPCEDTPGYTDHRNHSCAYWGRFLPCTTIAEVYTRYNDIQLKAIVASCPLSCQLCPSAGSTYPRLYSGDCSQYGLVPMSAATRFNMSVLMTGLNHPVRWTSDGSSATHHPVTVTAI